MATGHGGNLRALAAQAGVPPERLLDFSASVNPLGPPECLRPTISRHVDQLTSYPDPDCAALVAALAAHYHIASERIVVGNGSTELLFAAARVPLSPCGRGEKLADALIPVPSYLDYATAARAAGREVRYLTMAEGEGLALNWSALDREIRDGDMLFLGQPNNPTGLLLDSAQLCDFATRHPRCLLVVDEAFADFAPGYRSLAQNAELPANVVVLRAMTKFYAIPGLRLGFAVAAPQFAARIREHVLPWSVNALAQAVGVAVLTEEDYARRSVALVKHERERLTAELGRLPGVLVYRSVANYLLVRLPTPLSAGVLAAELLRERIAIRTFGAGEHLDDRFFRVAVRTAEENDRLLAAVAVQLPFANVSDEQGERTVGWVERSEPHRNIHVAPMVGLAALDPPYNSRQSGGQTRTRAKPVPPRRPALMFQGTSSNAGKSLLTAALCRILFQDGFRVAPFKSQNMSLNSFVTRDGHEMGRAQVVQAQACRLEPDVRMNPILLKPNSDTGCQVIVRGKPVGNMRVAEYIAYKPEAFVAARQCYDSLAAEFDAVVLEGAGSPGEVNLKSHDIVNMRMAQHAHAPVLVVGDIDRGGVFAAFVGTMEVLAPWERQLVAGWVVNRFRGDASLLDSALAYTRDYTGRPVLGVVPYLAHLNLPEEDSVEFKSGALDGSGVALARPVSGHGNAAAPTEGTVEIAVIDLPHLSNFTDFDAFRVESDVRLRIVRSPADLHAPDAVILGGSKNTLADLQYLRTSGLAEQIACLARQGKTEIVGICGGFQMLGRAIRDPLAVESSATEASAGNSRGLALLEIDTVMAEEKTLVRTAARHAPSGLPVAGYEIHHGQSVMDRAVPLVVSTAGEVLGAGRGDHAVWGTYLHGIFDADAFRRWFIDRLRTRRGLAALGGATAAYDIEPALERLAEVVRRSLPIEDIYRLMGLR